MDDVVDFCPDCKKPLSDDGVCENEECEDIDFDWEEYDWALQLFDQMDGGI